MNIQIRNEREWKRNFHLNFLPMYAHVCMVNYICNSSMFEPTSKGRRNRRSCGSGTTSKNCESRPTKRIILYKSITPHTLGQQVVMVLFKDTMNVVLKQYTRQFTKMGYQQIYLVVLGMILEQI